MKRNSVALFAMLVAIAGGCNEDCDTVVVSPATTYQNAWVNKAPMPTGRQAMAAAAVNGKVYSIGGWTGSTEALPVEEYDPVTDTWTTKASIPTPRNSLAATALNGKIYVVGGWKTSGTPYVIYPTLEVYDPGTDTWATRAPMPTARLGLAAVSVNGRIYAIGGRDLNTSLSIVEIYDPGSDNWSSGTPMPTDRFLLSAATVSGKIYAMGGSSYLSGGFTDLAANEEYDPVADAWVAKAWLPVNQRGQATAAVNGFIYIIGGINGFQNRNERYDPVSDAWWRRDDMLTGRWDPSGAVVNGRIYVLGGSGGYTKNEEYTP